MGKRQQNESKAFQKAKQVREQFIKKMNKCDSYEHLISLQKEYNEKKKKEAFKIPQRFSDYHHQQIAALTRRINKLFDKLSKKFPQPLVNSEKQVVSTPIESTVVLSNDLPLSSTKKLNSVLKEQTSQKSESESKETVVDEETKVLRELHLTKVRKQLVLIHVKQAEFEDESQKLRAKGKQKEAEKYDNAATAAKNIRTSIDKLCTQYINDGNLETFKAESKQVLNEEKSDVKILQEHRGWGEILANLAAFILTAGIAHAGYALYNRKFSMFKPATDAGQKVDVLHDAINGIVAAPSA